MERKFRCIKPLYHNYEIINDYVLIDYIEEFKEEGFTIFYDLEGYVNDLYFEKDKVISYDIYIKLCWAIEDVYEYFQEITPAEIILKKSLKEELVQKSWDKLWGADYLTTDLSEEESEYINKLMEEEDE